jgi:hypothetical protein
MYHNASIKSGPTELLDRARDLSSCGFTHNLSIDLPSAGFVSLGERKLFKKIIRKFLKTLKPRCVPISYIAYLADASFETPARIHILLKLRKAQWPEFERSVEDLWAGLCEELDDDFLQGSISSMETLYGEEDESLKLSMLEDFISMLRINIRNSVRHLGQFDEGFLRAIFL